MSAAVSRTPAAESRAREWRPAFPAGRSPEGRPAGREGRRATAQAQAAGPAEHSGAQPEAGAHRASGRRWRLRWRAGLHRGDRGVED